MVSFRPGLKIQNPSSAVKKDAIAINSRELTLRRGGAAFKLVHWAVLVDVLHQDFFGVAHAEFQQRGVMI